MKIRNRNIPQTIKPLFALLLCVMVSIVLTSCGGTSYKEPTQIVQVGTATGNDLNLPPEPTLPTGAQVCATLQASDLLVTRPDGALPPGADPSVVGAGVAASAATTNPDQARIQLALDTCGAGVDLKDGPTIAAADAAAAAAQVTAAVPNVNIAGASAEELAKPVYKTAPFAVRLAVSSTPGGGNAFISGPLTLPSGVTLWIDKGVTLFASRDVMLYNVSGKYCANTAVSATGAGSSGNCTALITGTNIVNSAVVGDGSIDSRGYAEIVTTNALYPLMKVDMTCSNTYANFISKTPVLPALLPAGTSCDNGGTFVDTKSSARNMTWWDLAWMGNMIENGTTGAGSQSVFRMMVFNYAKNLTLYRVTLNNSANFHVVPSGVDGFIVWGVKVQTPSLAAYQNPAGNGNPLYTGLLYAEDNVKNTDAFDPGSASKAINQAGKLTTGSKTTSAFATKFSFDGYLKNMFFVYNYVSTGDDDIALKGSNNPSPTGSGLPGIDGSRGVFSTLPWGVVIAHNHIYWGHGISIGSETNAGVQNMHAYDNSFNGSEEGLRIKSDVARGGEVANIYYDNMCLRGTLNSLLFTGYYSIKAGGGLYPNFHDIHLNNISIQGSTGVKLQGFQAGLTNPQYPLVMTLNNVVTDTPSGVSLIDSDANLTLTGLVNLPLVNAPDKRVVVSGTAVQDLDPALVKQKVLDCSQAYVDFPSLTSPTGTSWPMPVTY